MSTSPWDPARQQQPVRPSLQALHAASAPPALSDSLDELEGSLVALTVDLNKLAVSLEPVLHPDEDPLPPHLTGLTERGMPEGADLSAAPAVRRVQEALRQVRAVHDHLFDIASRIAL